MRSVSDLIADSSRWRQSARLLALTTPLGADVLLAESATIDEALGPLGEHAGFRIEVTALSADAGLPLASLLGRPARLDLLTAASRTELRPFHGHVTQATRLGGDGGFARYRLTIEPWLSFLGHTRDCYLFQERTVVEIVDELLGDWQAKGDLVPAWRWELADPAAYPRRGMTTQYRESDLAFLKRLLAEEGLFCWFEHAADTSATFGSHTLVIADHSAAFRANPQPQVRFTQAGATLSEDSIERWAELARIDTAAMRSASWDYRSLATRPQAAESALALDARIAAVARDDPGSYAWPAAADGERMMRRQRESMDARMRQTSAEGTLRSAAPGTTFTLTDHARYAVADAEQRRFLITAVTHHARNNLATPLRPDGQRQEREEAPAGFYRNRMHCIPAALPWRAALRDGHGRILHPRPSATGPMTAIVVGDCTGANEPTPTHCDRDHRVRVQFHWQRGSRSSSRRPHPSGSDNAPANSTRGIWLRVLAPVAGADWGVHFVPRPGQEVLIAFLNGNIDRPVVVGSVYNGQGNTDAAGNRVADGPQRASANAPAWFAGRDDPAHTHGASLSGLKTQELSTTRDGAGGHNQLVFDGAPGEARSELSTTAHASRLQLGHLKQQSDNARLASRGHGAELATGAALAIRAARGLLVSADRRPDARGSHLDSDEAIERTEHACDLVQGLAAVARKHRADDAESRELPAHASLACALDVLRGTATHENTRAGTRADPPRAAAGGNGTVAAWTRARIQYNAPAGIAQLASQNLILTAGRHFVTATGDAQFVSQGSHAMAVAGGIALFTVGKAAEGGRPATRTGIRLHAAHGDVSLQSQRARFNAAADRKVTLASQTATLSASARKHILATAQGAYLRIEGGNIELHAPGKVTFKASSKNLTGPQSSTSRSHNFPRAELAIESTGKAKYPISL